MTAELVCAATDRDAWLEARRTGVTATDIVTILGLGPSSEYALYWEKLGKLPPWEGNARTRLGQELEDYAMGLWGRAHDDAAYELAAHLYRSAARPWQLATPDAVVLDSEPRETTWEVEVPAAEARGVLEIKTWDDHDRDAWADGLPPRVRAQVLWQMDTLGVAVGHVGVLFLPSGEFESRVIEHRAGLDTPPGCPTCSDVAYMRAQGELFWSRVRQERPPFPDGSPATLRAVKALHAGVCAGQVEVSPDAWSIYEKEREAVALSKAGLRAAEAALRIELGDAETGTVGGEPVVKRTRYEVAGKTVERKAYTVDKLTRLGARNGDSDGASADNG